MTEASENVGESSKQSLSGPVEDYVRMLSDEHKMLVILKSQLYSGKWEPMLDDLANRLEGKPYIFKLAARVKDDVDRINEMMDFEKAHHVDLADHVDLT